MQRGKMEKARAHSSMIATLRLLIQVTLSIISDLSMGLLYPNSTLKPNILKILITWILVDLVNSITMELSCYLITMELS